MVNLYGDLLSRKGLRESLARPSAWVLIAVNLGMIAGVVVLGWSVLEIVFLYWVENLVVGAINVPRMALARGDLLSLPGVRERLQLPEQAVTIKATRTLTMAGHALKFFFIPFFILHYGGFCFGHGIFVLAMFGEGGWLGGSDGAAGTDIRELLTPGMLLAILMLVASHLFSFFRNYLAGGEFRRTHAAAMMMRPYGRIVALHITILAGAFLTALSGSTLGMLIVLVVLKTAADLTLHSAERKKLGTPAG